MARSADPCELTSSIVVSASVQQCWDLYINNGLLAEWAPAVSGVECSEPVVAMNVRRQNNVCIDGREGYTVEQCTLLDPLKRIEFNITEETFGFSHMLTSYGFSVSFDVEGNNTLMIMQTRYVPKKIFASVMSSKTTQQQLLNLMSDTLHGFKQYLENQIKTA